MKIIGKISLKYIMKNKLRTIFTLLGIIISISMITSIGNILLTLDREFKEDLIDRNGIYDLEIKDVSKDDILDVLEENIIKDYYVIERGKNIVQYDEAKGGNRLFEIEIRSGDNRYYLDNFHYKIIEGRLPKNESEILIPYEIKDVFPGLSQDGFGKKYNIVEDESFLQDLNEDSFENFDPKSIRKSLEGKVARRESLKVVGYYSGYIYINTYKKGSLIGGIAYSFKDSSKLDEVNQAEVRDLRIFLKDYKSKEDVEKKAQYLEEKIGKEVEINESYLSYKDLSFHYLGPFIISFISLLIIIILLSISIFISSIFTSNYVEKIKDLGLLKVVGFTNKQVFLMILLDSLFYFVIAIPLGYLSGVLAMKLVFARVNKILMESIDGIYTNFEPLTSINIFIISAVIGFLIIFISNLSSGLFLFKNSPIESLEGRGLGGGKTNLKKTGKVSSFIRKYFSYDFFLAARNISRHRRRFLMTTSSIAMSIVLFVVVSDMTNLFKSPFGKLREEGEANYGYIVIGEDNFKDLLKDLEDIEGLEIARQPVKYNFEIFNYSDSPSREDYDYLNILIMADRDFSKSFGPQLGSPIFYSEKYDLKGKKEIYIDLGGSLGEDLNEEGPVDFQVDKLRVKTIGKEIFKNDNLTNYSSILEENNYNLFISETYYAKLASKLSSPKFAINISRVGNNPLLRHELDRLYFNYEDMYISGATNKSIYKITRLFIYGFISLISVIGGLNVINSTHSNIITRKREMALLKAVGVEDKRLGKILCLENVISLLLAGLLSFIGSLIFTIIQYKLKKDNLPESVFVLFNSIYVFPFFYWLIGLFIAGILVYLSMFIPYKKVNLKNITELLK